MSRASNDYFWASAGVERPSTTTNSKTHACERRTKGRKLLTGPTDSDPEYEPAAGEVVEVGRHPGHQQWMPVRHDQHGGAQADPGRRARQPGQRGQRIKKRRWVFVGDVGRDRDMIGHHEQVETQVLHGVRPGSQQAGVGARAEVRHIDT